MEQSFYKDRLAAHSLEVIVPAAADRAIVHRTIDEEFCMGVIREESREAHRGIIDRLVAAGAGGWTRLNRDRAARAWYDVRHRSSPRPASTSSGGRPGSGGLIAG